MYWHVIILNRATFWQQGGTVNEVRQKKESLVGL